MISNDNINILALLDKLMEMQSVPDIANKIASDFRRRRIEKGLTRQEISLRSGVALSNIARFEQKGLISLQHLIALAVTLGYNGEIRSIFETPKYNSINELEQIHRNSGKKRAYTPK